jgi:putative ABC transport system permease protein
MYPGLVAPLLIGLVICLSVVAFLAIGRPVLRRLAVRQISRRPAEAFIVVAGSLLGTTLIVASLVVGDSLDRSVRQTAYDVLGPIDETVRISSSVVGEQAVGRLVELPRRSDVDGLLVVRQDLSAATYQSGGTRVAVPRTIVTELDFAEAARFGGPGQSGLNTPDPGPNGVVVNRNLADSLGIAVGDRVTFHLYAKARDFTVTSIVAPRGVAGSGIGAAVNRDAFFSVGVLTAAAKGSDVEPSTVVFVSNRGGVQSGAAEEGGSGRRRAHGGRAGFDVPLHRQLQHHRWRHAPRERLRHAGR